MIEYEKRAMIEAEDKYTFRQSTQISMQTGLIGHLRADMDTDGNGFFSSWFDFREELKTDEFKAEFDDIINSLREEGDILHNRRALAKYCYCTPQSRMQEEPGYYGVRVDTEKYAYLLRLNPDRGEYNLYCYCYRRDWLDQHLKDAEKGIRFIDSHYKELFRIPDGGKVKILPQLLLRHVAQLGIGEQLRRLGDGPLRAAIVLVALRDRLKLLLLLREPPQLLRVAVDLRHGQQLSDLRAAARDLFQLLPHCFSSPPSCSSSHCG